MTSADDCSICPEGTFCSVGSAQATSCAPGTYNAEPKQDSCTKCEAGKFQDEDGSTECKDCTAGYYCGEGAAAALPCPGGTSKPTDLQGAMISKDQCLTCPAGTSCSVGSALPSPCLPGSYGKESGQATCELCDAGKYTPDLGRTACKDCTDGALCVRGSSAPQPCPGGTHADQAVLATVGFLSNLETECVICRVGTFCPVGSAAETDCPPGTYNPQEKAMSCLPCPAGLFQNQEGQTACKRCTRGFYCEQRTAKPTPCPAGTSSNKTSLTSEGHCALVPVDFWAPLGSAVPEPCPPSGFYCPGAAADRVMNPPGSKPIIQPTGGSTKKEEVPAVTKSMLLDMSIDDFAAQREALIQAMATEYGVPSSQIVLEANAGSLQLTITITTGGTATNIDDIIAGITSIDDSALATALGTALGTGPITVSTTTAPQQTMVEHTVIFTCPKGKWCTAGLVVDCPEGTYNPHEGKENGLACLKCPEFSSSPLASSDVSDCTCQQGFTQVCACTTMKTRTIPRRTLLPAACRFALPGLLLSGEWAMRL